MPLLVLARDLEQDFGASLCSKELRGGSSRASWARKVEGNVEWGRMRCGEVSCGGTEGGELGGRVGRRTAVGWHGDEAAHAGVGDTLPQRRVSLALYPFSQATGTWNGEERTARAPVETEDAAPARAQEQS